MIGTAHAWPASRGLTPPTYVLQDVRNALRRCHLQLNRYPTAAVYKVWRRGEIQRARRVGRVLHLPSYRVVYRFYPASAGGWAAAVAEAMENGHA